MKLFFAESNHNYPQVLLLREEKDDLEKIYSKGFLPFRNQANLFYLARSCRVDLEKFSLSSENKRIIKKTADFSFGIKSLKDFNYTSRVQKQCKDWAKLRNWKISTTSLKYIFKGGFFNQLMVWEKEGEAVAYQVLLEEKDLIHTAHLFYNPEVGGKDLGMRMLIEASILGKEKEKTFHYLGTAYGGTGFYKRNLAGFEFFNGFSWSEDLKEWKYLDQRESDDYLLRDQEYLEQFGGEEKLKSVLKSKGISFSF